jgi:hypothetical protein
MEGYLIDLNKAPVSPYPVARDALPQPWRVRVPLAAWCEEYMRILLTLVPVQVEVALGQACTHETWSPCNPPQGASFLNGHANTAVTLSESPDLMLFYLCWGLGHRHTGNK